MNRKLLALAIAAALTAPFAAQAAPTVYGQLNLSVDMVDQESSGDLDPFTPGDQTLDEFQVNSNSSRLGVKGEEDLGNGYSAVYKAEFGVDGDTASGLSGRDRYLGLKSTWGTLKLGAYDSPLKSSQGNVDQFNDMTFTDMHNYFYGENRMDNLIGYESPKIADSISIKLALQPGESTVSGDDSFADGMSASVAYEAAGLYLALAIDKDVNNDPTNGAFSAAVGDGRDAVRLVATYAMDALQFGAMIQTSETSEEGIGGAAQDDEEGLLVSAAFTMGKNVLKGQVAMVNHDFGGGAEADDMFIGVGVDHNFTGMTKAFAQVSVLSSDNPGAVADTDDTVLTVGMQTKF